MMIWDYAITVDHIMDVTPTGNRDHLSLGNNTEKHSGKKKYKVLDNEKIQRWSGNMVIRNI
jgi:hypothetical protein